MRYNERADFLMTTSAVASQNLALLGYGRKSLRATNRRKQIAQVFSLTRNFDSQSSLSRSGWIRTQRQDHPSTVGYGLSQIALGRDKFTLRRFQQTIDSSFRYD